VQGVCEPNSKPSRDTKAMARPKMSATGKTHFVETLQKLQKETTHVLPTVGGSRVPKSIGLDGAPPL